MGILGTLLAFPAKAPLSGVTWVASKLTEAAEAQFYDPEAIKGELARQEARLEAGEITEDEYEEVELDLLLRLKHGRGQGR